jgi:hypothetical protein
MSRQQQVASSASQQRIADRSVVGVSAAHVPGAAARTLRVSQRSTKPHKPTAEPSSPVSTAALNGSGFQARRATSPPPADDPRWLPARDSSLGGATADWANNAPIAIASASLSFRPDTRGGDAAAQIQNVVEKARLAVRRSSTAARAAGLTWTP